MPAEDIRSFFPPDGCLGTLSTCSSAGEPNAALFGSARLLDDEHLVLALGDNRSLRNLRQQPRAVFLVAEPGPTMLQWRGVRLYLELERIEREGELLDELRTAVRASAGRGAARRLQAAVVFRIVERRGLLELSP